MSTEIFKSDVLKQALLAQPVDGPGFVEGESVFIRTVTYHLTGRVAGIRGKFLILEDAAWIPDSGRFTPAINNGTLEEVEPVDVVVRVNLDSIVDVYYWPHTLPRKQK